MFLLFVIVPIWHNPINSAVHHLSLFHLDQINSKKMSAATIAKEVAKKMSEKKARKHKRLIVPKKLENASDEEKKKWRDGQYQKNRNLKKREKRLEEKSATKTTVPELAESADDKYLKYENVVQISGVQYLRSRKRLEILAKFSDRERLDKRDNIDIPFSKMNRRLVKHYHSRDPSTFSSWPRSVQLVIKESPRQYPKITAEQCNTIRPRYVVSKRDDEKFFCEMKTTLDAFDLETKNLLRAAKNKQKRGIRLLVLGSKRKYDDEEGYDEDESKEENKDDDKTDDEEDYDVVIKPLKFVPVAFAVPLYSEKTVNKFDLEIERDVKELKEEIARREKEVELKKKAKTKAKVEVKNIKTKVEPAVSVVHPPSLPQPVDANLTAAPE